MLSLLNKYGTLLIFALGICLYVIHMQHSNIAGLGVYTNWTIDSESHLEYIAWVSNTLTIPVPSACWECHQPPLYYILAAYAYSIAQDFHLAPPVIAVSLFSLVFYMGFLLFGARLLKMEVQSRLIYYIGLCLLVFWPYGVTKATMISNDVPLYMAEAAAFYYIMRWRRDEIPTSLALALLWNAIAIAFKYSGIIVAPFIGLIFLLQYYKKHHLTRQLLAKPVLLCFCISLVLVGSTFARTYHHYRIANHTNLPMLVPSVPEVIKKWPIANNRLEYFIMPHFIKYGDSPFLGHSKQPFEMRFFLNSVLKTSLFSMTFWKPAKTAYVLYILALGMISYMAYSLTRITIQNRSYLTEVSPSVTFVLIQLFALAAYRLLYPHSGNQDFRFIYPVTIAMTVLYAKILSWQRKHSHHKTFWLGALLPACFSTTSIAFILLNAWG